MGKGGAVRALYDAFNRVPIGILWGGRGEQKIENFAFRAGAKGARIRDLRGESFRTVGSLLNLAHKNAIS